MGTGGVQLEVGNQRATISTLGGRVVAYAVAGRDVIAGEEPADRPYYRSALLAPWPNRVAGGVWAWEGETHQLAVSEPDRGTALHGLVGYAPFSVVEQGPDRVVLRHDLQPSDGYPFSLQVDAGYSLGPTGLSCSLSARNTGQRDAPVGLGVHPYVVTRGPVDDVTLQLPAGTLVEGDHAWEETGRTPLTGSELDFRHGRRIGAAEIDACWTDVLPDVDGTVRCVVGFPDGDAVVVWGGPTTRYLVVYNSSTLPEPDRRRSLAVEPCTAPANALRSGVDLTIVAPGHSLELTWGMQPSWR